MRNLLLTSTVLLSLCCTAGAEWRDHPELPDWCQRGKVRWVHGFSKMDVAQVNMLLEWQQNLKQSSTFADEEAAALARAGGLRYQPYICSKKIPWRKLFETHPQLKEAVCLDPEGNTRLMYASADHYGGCYWSPLWRAYVKERITQTVEAWQPDSIFFDNINCMDCYCELCRERFPASTRELLGEEMTLDGSTGNPLFGFAKLMFDTQGAVDFFNEIRAHIAETSPKPLMVVPNTHVGLNWHAYLTWSGINDLVFYEQGRDFPPFARQIYGYKFGLALSHGKVVGQLLGLPATVTLERALKWGPEYYHGQPEVKEAYTYPEEYQLAIAEGAACDATFIPSVSIREQQIRPTDGPHMAQVRAAIKQYYDFLVKHEDLYVGAQPGASTAVLYSIWTNMHDRKAQNLRALSEDLMRAGVPFEVITEDDLTDELLAPYDALILDHVKNLRPEDCEVVDAFANSGRSVVMIGECALADRLGAEQRPPRWEQSPGEQAEVRAQGAGRMVRMAGWPRDLPGAELRAQLAVWLGPAAGAIPPSDRLVVNLLRSAQGEGLQVHLLNYDFRYQRVQQDEVADDDGSAEARTYLADTRWRARKVLTVDAPAGIEEPVVRFFGSSPGGAGFELIVSLNGRDLKTFPGPALTNETWHEAPAGDALKAGENLVEFRVTGSPNTHPDWFGLRIDAAAGTRRSLWSVDEGASFATEDLSPDPGAQQGEYMVRIIDKASYRDTFTPEDFDGKLQVVPARNVKVTVPARRGGWHATCLSPDHDPLALKPIAEDQASAVFEVPSVHIYEVIVLEPGV